MVNEGKKTTRTEKNADNPTVFVEQNIDLIVNLFKEGLLNAPGVSEIRLF